jgi:DNA-directed RNA polymerase subunit L/DNA-directed RNA polymerase alpha subunit
MSLISNFIVDKDILTFDLNNIKDIKKSLANAIRRVIISDIYCYAIDDHSVNFIESYENDVILNNEFLIHRLTLIPIISDLNIDYENIQISCKKENIDENILSIYAKDFICTNLITNEIIDNTVLFKYPNILFSKLKNKQKISFECKLIKNNASHGGSFFSTVSTCIYTFKSDIKQIEEKTKEMTENIKKEFMLQEYERYFERNEIGDPNVYQFVIESIGFYDCKTILLFGIESLKNKLNLLKTEFKNENSKKIIYLDNINENDETFFKFMIDNENETIGNLLSTYISNNSNIFFCGYLIEHPLKKNIILKIKQIKNNNLENILLTIDSVINILIELLDIMISDINS